MTEFTLRRIAMVGFGEAGSILAEELAAADREVVTYDILLDTPASRATSMIVGRRASGGCSEAIRPLPFRACLPRDVISSRTLPAAKSGARNGSNCRQLRRYATVVRRHVRPIIEAALRPYQTTYLAQAPS